MRKGLTLLLFCLVFSFSFISLISAIPPEPMAFYGKVTYNNGIAIPNGYYLTAKIGSAVNGECEIIDGIYGKGQDPCIVVSHLGSSQKIEFFLGNEKLGEYTFEAREIVNLDFTVTSLPTNPTPASDGVCELSKGECSYNVLDCDASKTSVCLGNGVCDSIIGETCTNAASDCGTCPTQPQPPSGGGGGGGGGDGGSGGGSNSVITLSSNETCIENWQCSDWSNVDKQCGTRSCNDLNKCGTSQLKPQTSKKCTSTSLFGITGGAIGAFVTSGEGILTFLVVIGVAMLVILFFVLKKGKAKGSEVPITSLEMTTSESKVK